MSNERKFFDLMLTVIGLITVGASLLAYGHETFARKDNQKDIKTEVKELRKDVRKIMVHLGVQ